MTTRIQPVSRKAFQFFMRNAGYIVGFRAKTAVVLARAEAWAQRRGLTFAWEDDPNGWGWDGPAPERVMVCVAQDHNGKVIACLGGIADPDRTYERVVEAELALEARGEEEEA